MADATGKSDRKAVPATQSLRIIGVDDPPPGASIFDRVEKMRPFKLHGRTSEPGGRLAAKLYPLPNGDSISIPSSNFDRTYRNWTLTIPLTVGTAGGEYLLQVTLFDDNDDLLAVTERVVKFTDI